MLVHKNAAYISYRKAGIKLVNLEEFGRLEFDPFKIIIQIHLACTLIEKVDNLNIPFP